MTYYRNWCRIKNTIYGLKLCHLTKKKPYGNLIFNDTGDDGVAGDTTPQASGAVRYLHHGCCCVNGIDHSVDKLVKIIQRNI